MTIATRLDHYLTDHHIPYEAIRHDPSVSSLHSAIEAHVPPVHIAKGIILEDHEGRHLMAVLPANAKVSLSILNDEFRASYHLVKEHDVYRMFEDCQHGAVPPLGNAYHMSMVCDSALTELDYVYIEAGDHETLIKLDKEAFKELMGHSRYLSFASQVFH
jgi:Ala-tRNA(Pro) deacylase